MSNSRLSSSASSALRRGNTRQPAQEANGGKRAARDANLEAVVDALLDLFAEGNLRPAAAEIAARSGLSRRSLFRYFTDLETLDRLATQRQIARVQHLLDIPELGAGELSDRIARLVKQRVELFEAILPVARVSRLRAPFEAVVSLELARSRRVLRRQAEVQFGQELSQLSRTDRRALTSAIDILCSFEGYELLRVGHSQSPRQIGDAMRMGLASMIAARPIAPAG